MDAQVDHMVDVFQITPEEQSNPALVDYWKTPFKLAKRESKCKSYLQFSKNQSIVMCRRTPI